MNNNPDSTHRRKTVYVANLVSFCSELQITMRKVIQPDDGIISHPILTLENLQITSLLKLIQHQSQHLDSLLKRKKVNPARLPLPSYRAFVWLRFLAQEKHLLKHLCTLWEFSQLVNKMEITKSNLLRFRGFPVLVYLYYIPYIYRTQIRHQRIEIAIHENFIASSIEVKQDLLLAALNGNSLSLKKVRDYCSSAAYRRIEQLIRADAHGPASSARGNHYDLKAVFERVNLRYFHGELDQPQLAWSQKRSRRKLGSYAADVDTITISRTFDIDDLPDYVIDYIMYHELLHKKLGVKKANSRKRNHNLTFKQLEKEFAYYQQAADYISRLTSSMRY